VRNSGKPVEVACLAKRFTVETRVYLDRTGGASFGQPSRAFDRTDNRSGSMRERPERRSHPRRCRIMSLDRESTAACRAYAGALNAGASIDAAFQAACAAYRVMAPGLDDERLRGAVSRALVSYTRDLVGVVGAPAG
jgi:hypothetical protein